MHRNCLYWEQLLAQNFDSECQIEMLTHKMKTILDYNSMKIEKNPELQRDKSILRSDLLPISTDHEIDELLSASCRLSPGVEIEVSMEWI